MSQPFVTIIIPSRNEEQFISNCLDSLLENDYNKKLIEIFIVDGLSRDSSRSIVSTYIERFNFIKLLNNPRKTFPSAVNIGIQASKGKLLFIMGAHAVYERQYISKCVDNSLKYDADNTGGILVTLPKDASFFGDIITTALTSKFGVGNSVFRTGTDKVMEVDTVFGGCYRKEVFDRIGLFNEKLISSSDYEFNKRLRRNGGKIILVPEIKTVYYTRATLKSFLVNNFRNGFWSVYPIAFVDYIPVSLRHLVPLTFVLSLISSFVLSLFSPFFSFLFIGILIVYFMVALFFSVKTLKLKMIIFLPFFFFILHFSYGAGSLLGAGKILLTKIIKL
jgi:glycosyltransferase involved in cell wall biosynthesis